MYLVICEKRCNVTRSDRSAVPLRQCSGTEIFTEDRRVSIVSSMMLN